MSVLTRVTQVIGETVKFKPKGRAQGRAPGVGQGLGKGRPQGRRGGRFGFGLSKARPERVVEVKAATPRAGSRAGSGAGPGAVPTATQIEPAEPKITKQELLTELQQNYKEVIELVRKVNGRLDEQETRAKRLMEIAERVPGAMDLIPEINEHTARSAGSLVEIADATKASNQRAEAAAQTHSRVLEALGDRLNSAAEAESRVGETLGDLNTTIGSMTGATDQLAAVMRGVQHRDARRDEQVQTLVTRTNRWMLAAVALGASSVLISLVVSLVK